MATRMVDVDSAAVDFAASGDEMVTDFAYRRNQIGRLPNGRLRVTPKTHSYQFRTRLTPQRTGLMLVGMGGNNGTTITGAIIANRHKMTWRTKAGIQESNYWGSVTQATTVHIGFDGEEQVYLPFKSILPMVEPNSLIIDGWDINGANMADAMERAQVFEPELQTKLRPYMEQIVPRPSIYYPDFIASNQADRANHTLEAGATKQQHLERIRADIRDFKHKHQLECVIVLWTANTERFCDTTRANLNLTADQLLASIERGDAEVPPSQIFAVAAVLEGAHYINGSPQNTLVDGLVELAGRQRPRVFLGGDDFKSGQTKLKSVLVDFLVASGLKPQSIVSYNHLGNNDGRNLSEEPQFKSKEITKSSVVDDMVASNRLLYPTGRKPDHCIVIKYVPYVGDSKRAMDEYVSSIFMGGHNTMVVHNTCEDSLLAAPLILDLALITELCSRIAYRTTDDDECASAEGATASFSSFAPVLSLLACLLKAPAVPRGTPVCNALMKQLSAVTKLLTAVAGLHSDCDMQLEFFAPPSVAERRANDATTDVGQQTPRRLANDADGGETKTLTHNGCHVKNGAGVQKSTTNGYHAENGVNGVAH